MKRFFLLLLAVLLLGAPRASHAQVATWSVPLPQAIAADYGNFSASDPDGNTYVASTYQAGPLTLGPATLPGPRPNPTAVLAKIGPTGLVQWALAGTSSQAVRVLALTLDPNGTAYVVLYATGLTLGSRSLPGEGYMLARVSPTGTVAALTYLHSGPSVCVVRAAAADAAGNCYVSVINDTSTPELFNGYPIGGSDTALIVRAGPSGTVSLFRSLAPTGASGGGGYITLDDLQVGPGGAVYCAGQLNGTLALQASPALSVTSDGNFVARFDATGAGSWGVGTSFSYASVLTEPRSLKLAVGPLGQVYVAGLAIASSFTFGGLPVGAGSYVVRLSLAGVPKWARATPVLDTYNHFEVTKNATRLALDGAGNVYRLGLMTLPSATFGGVTLLHPDPTPGQLKTTAFYVVSYDSTGTARWARTVNGPTPATTSFAVNMGAGLSTDRSGNLYLLAALSGSPASAAQLQMDGQVLSWGNTLLRLSPGATLSGTIYLDQNNNSQRDAGEGPMPYPQLVTDAVQNRAFSSTSGTGEYSFTGPAGGAFSLTIPTPRASYTLGSPAVRTGTFPAVGRVTSGLDFGLVPVANQPDLRLTLTPYGPARAGLTTRYRLTLDNVGTTTLPAGTATLTLDALMQYVSSTPAGTLAGRVLSLPYAALAPFGSVSYDVLFSLPTNAALGTGLSATAAAPVAGDVAPADNTATLSQTVVGPYDPNSIEVNYQRLTPAQVAAKQPLDYTIHFQNLGTASAQNVILSDTLDFQKLNPATLMLVAQSHNCIWSLTSTGPNTGLLTVRFLGINLPEQNADVIRSMGFARFRVQPRPTLAVGEVIPNHARIVFDYNDAIRTNTATTTVFLASAALARATAPAWEAYPNPATDVLNLAADLPAAGPVRVELLDGLGRAVRRHTLAAPAGPLRQQLDLRGLAPGFYVLRLTPPTGPALSRQVVRE